MGSRGSWSWRSPCRAITTCATVRRFTEHIAHPRSCHGRSRPQIARPIRRRPAHRRAPGVPRARGGPRDRAGAARQALGFPVMAFLTLEIRQEAAEHGGHDAVARHLATIPEVLEAHTITGAGDLFARVV